VLADGTEIAIADTRKGKDAEGNATSDIVHVPAPGQEALLALWPSAYPKDTILNVLTLNGAPLAYNKNLGPGAGLMWQGKAFSISANYVAANGASGVPALGGVATTGSGPLGPLALLTGGRRANQASSAPSALHPY
jgi:hypothetical protein